MKFLLVLSCLYSVGRGFPEQGIEENTYTIGPGFGVFLSFSHSAYNGTVVHLKLSCADSNSNSQFKYQYVIRSSPCDNEFSKILGKERGGSSDALKTYFKHPNTENEAFNYKQMYVLDGSKSESTSSCTKAADIAGNDLKWMVNTFTTVPEKKPASSSSVVQATTPAAPKKSKRDAEETGPPAGSLQRTQTVLDLPFLRVNMSHDHDVIAILPADAIYLLMLYVESVTKEGGENLTIKVTAKWEGPSGYLSAVDYPLLPFYIIMCTVYVVFAVGWLIACALKWRELLQVQYWIGGFILLGMVEQAVFVAEYKEVNQAGESVVGAIQFAEVVSCFKKALARVIVIIICTGFGVVKPRLGNTLQKVTAVGIVYFGFCSLEALSRVSVIQQRQTKTESRLWGIPLVITDVGIGWWIFSALWSTMRALRLRRNDVKLWLYRHFAHTLIFAALASAIFMAWSLYIHTFTACLTDWKELWVETAYWHLLFVVVLLVIMILWRPMNNNQRYAFVPLLDSADLDDEDEDTYDPEVFNSTEKMQLRSVNQTNRQEAGKATETSIEDELKWVEENIPSTLADKAMPALVDSDDEKEQVRYELSKIQ